MLTPKLSYRAFGASVVLVDHRSGEILELDGAVAPLLDRLDRGEPVVGQAELAMLAALDELHLVEHRAALAETAHSRTDERSGEPMASAPPGTAQRGSIEQGAPSEHPDLLEELNARAAAALVPLHAQLELTHRCAFECDFCYLSPRRPLGAPELQLDEIEQLLGDLAAAGGLFLLLTGGEPLMRSDLERIVESARARRFAVSLLTSGYGLDGRLAARLAALGLDSVQVTIHDADPSRHDARTARAGSFDAAAKAIETWRALGVRTQMAVTVTQHNLPYLDPIAALSRALEVPVSLSCSLLPRRDGSRVCEALCVDEAGLAAAYRAFPSGVPARMAARGLDDRPCGAGASTIAIDSVGVVYPCHALREPVGSIRDARLSEIWRSSARLRAVRELRVRDLRDCPSCSLRPWCNRCAGLAVAEGGAMTDHSPQDCAQARARAGLR